MTCEDEPDIQAVLAHDLKDLKKSKTNLFNRLRSIQQDSQFVRDVCLIHFPELPVAPNLRCGAWYVDTRALNVVTSAVYFKSTDGHSGCWDFNLRRANLHLLPAIEAAGGLIITDSTRRGKRYPDALAKTVPIWCAVINRAISIKTGSPEFDIGLHTQPGSVPASEHDQILSRIGTWASILLDSTFKLPQLSKPLRPLWLSPDSNAIPSLEAIPDFLPIICLSASEQIIEGVERRHGFVYVQGSGDDHESWSQGLTPEMYWNHCDDFCGLNNDEMERKVAEVVLASTRTSNNIIWKAVRYTENWLRISSFGYEPQLSPDDLPIIIISPKGAPSTNLLSPAQCLWVLIRRGKAGQLDFMNGLPEVEEFSRKHLGQGARLSIASEGDYDYAIGLALAILAKFFDEGGVYRGENGRIGISKKSIRARLQWIQQSYPDANPSRTIMNRVNEYLLSPRSFRARLV